MNKNYFFLPFIMIGFVLISCQPINEMKQTFADLKLPTPSLTKLTKAQNDNCPSFSVTEELDRYYDLPKTNNPEDAAGFSQIIINDFSGECSMNQEKDEILLTLFVEFETTPGPFAESETIAQEPLEIEYFVAVIDEQENILAKDNFSVPFDMQQAQAAILHKETLEQVIPISEGRDPKGLSILTGFQLTNEQLKYAQTVKANEIMPAAGDVLDPLAN